MKTKTKLKKIVIFLLFFFDGGSINIILYVEYFVDVDYAHRAVCFISLIQLPSSQVQCYAHFYFHFFPTFEIKKKIIYDYDRNAFDHYNLAIVIPL